MCGIYGSIERGEAAARTVFAGLKDIEYRGYDSWGVAYAESGKIEIVKDTGFLPNRIDLPDTGIAIGHTRWATHGGVTRENAHPHTDCTDSLALVHNGIVENANNLKESLRSGHNLRSQTDTEVIVHMLEEELQRQHRPLSEAVKTVFQKLDGFNALLATNGDEIVAAQKGSSLVIGEKRDGFVVSSDPNALLSHTKNLHFVEDGAVISLSEQKTKIPFDTVDWQYQPQNLGQFPHFMLKEIMDQPQALDRLLKNPGQIHTAAQLIAEARNAYLIGCGSANYAGMIGEALFSEYGNKLTHAYAASEFGSKQKHLKSADLLIAISQSGETIDLLEQVRAAQQNGVPTLAILNRMGSALYREVSSKIMLDAGQESAVVATKSFTNMVATFTLLSHQLSGSYKTGENMVAESINSTQKVLDNREEIAQIAREVACKPHLFVLGRDNLYPAALEVALKIKEASYLHAEGFPGGELKHGVLALIEEGVPVLALIPSLQNSDILTNIAEVKARGANVIPIEADGIIPKVVFGQLLSYYIALEKGLNPDRPRNLAKSVTVK